MGRCATAGGIDPADCLHLLALFDTVAPMTSRPAFPSFDFTNLDVSKLDVSKLDLSKLDLSKLDLSKIDLPKFDLPAFRLPTFDRPKVDFDAVPRPDVDTDRVLGFARDAAYVGIGLTVLAIQQSQVRRRELQRRITDAVDTVTRRAA